jgi:hypothetical protein
MLIGKKINKLQKEEQERDKNRLVQGFLQLKI